MKRLYAGIDLHSNNSVLVISNEVDAVVFEKRLKNDMAVILEAFAPYASELAGVVVESTFNWYWLVDGLAAAGFEVRLANTVAIQQYSGLKYGDDKSDARWLARMLRLGVLPEAYIYPAEDRAVRDILRKRSSLVQQRTANILSIQNLVTRNTGGSPPGAAGVKKMAPEDVDALGLPADVALAVKASLAMVHCAGREIAALEAVARERVRLREGFKNLLTVDGIGPVLALTIMLETGSVWRFATVGDFVSYARCVGGERVSNGKKKGKTNTKNGNAYLSWAFSEAAQQAIIHNEKARGFYQRKLRKNHMMVARRALAHKIARACYYIMRDNTEFDEDKLFGGE